MMRSMYSGVSGLRVHQTKMDVIGNNIANVNTVGFKSQRVTFNDVFSQTVQSASGASDETGRGGRNPMQIGLGVNVSSIDILMTPGAAQRTDNPFDLMVDGSGFLVVGDTNGTYFTRAGALRLDADGNLVIPNGMKVKGWPSDKNGEKIVKGEVQDLNLNNFKTAEPKPTSKVELVGNMNTADSPITSQIKFYDSLGNYYQANISLKYDNTVAPPKWDVTPLLVDPTTGEVNKTDATKNTDVLLTDQNGGTFVMKSADFVNEEGELVFKDTGKIDVDPFLADGVTPNPHVSKPFSVKPLDFANANITMMDYSKKPGVPINNKKPNAKASAITMNVDKLTQFSSKTNLDPKVLDGQQAGILAGYDIGGDGKITAYYDNGARKTIGQVVVAEFANPAGLEKAGDNLFRTTTNSGDFDNIGKEGNFQAGVLEMSNVDLSLEFTEMITTQRGFQANSRIISTSDEMLQELVNIKR